MTKRTTEALSIRNNCPPQQMSLPSRQRVIKMVHQVSRMQTDWGQHKAQTTVCLYTKTRETNYHIYNKLYKVFLNILFKTFVRSLRTFWHFPPWVPNIRQKKSDFDSRRPSKGIMYQRCTSIRLPKRDPSRHHYAFMTYAFIAEKLNILQWEAWWGNSLKSM